MYSTIKELHVDIEQRISQITSNRHRSIAPQWIDMVLNRCAIRYIQQKGNPKTNYKREGFEESQKRVDDFKSLKKDTGYIQLSVDNSNKKGYVLFPDDYLIMLSSNSLIKYSKLNLDEYKKTESKSIVGTILDFSTLQLNNSNTWIDASINIHGAINKTIYITDLLPLIQDSENESDIFEFINILIDIFRDNGIDARWEYFDDKYNKQSLFVSSNVGDISVSIVFNDENGPTESGITNKEFNINSNIFINKGDLEVENDLIATEEINNIFNNYYLNRNRHKNPIAEVIKDRLYIYFGDNFIPTSTRISYIKKPKLFNYELNRMSDLEITPDFIDLVVSDLLLVLKDESYNAVKQQSNFE